MFLFRLNFVVVLLLVITCTNGTSQNRTLELTLSSKQDTVKIGSSYELTIELQNVSKKTVLVAENFVFISDIYPNPIEQINNGATVDFEITPFDKFGSIIVENQIFVENIEFVKLRPNKSIKVSYNLGQHLNDYMSMSNTDSLVNNNYEIKAVYALNRKTSDSKAFKKKIKSNTISIFIEK